MTKIAVIPLLLAFAQSPAAAQSPAEPALLADSSLLAPSAIAFPAVAPSLAAVDSAQWSLGVGGGSSSKLSASEAGAEALTLALLAMDAGQTLRIKGFCDNRSNCTVHETNPLLGAAPSRQRVAVYFATVAVAHVTVTLLLPQGAWRNAWLASGIALEATVIGRNKRLGLGWGGKF